MDADQTYGDARGHETRTSNPGEAHRRVFDDELELEPVVRSALEGSESSERLLWLEGQLELRGEAVARRVPRWMPGDTSLQPERVAVKAFDELLAETRRAATAAQLADKQIKEAHSRGVEAGAVGAVLVLGLIASAVAIGYALFEHFFA